jgi:pimeloyl-ACP methyl ester carboxylesterase
MRLPAGASPDVIQDDCPAPLVGLAVCGHVDVPLDYHRPGSGTTPIFFGLISHWGGGPAESAILVNYGGPGGGTTTDAYAVAVTLATFGTNLDVHDLLLIDDRGRGLSGTIDCPALQHGTELIPEATADCADQLGPVARDYASADIAMDTEAVRLALGYDLIDYYGGSYGAMDVTAYALRYAEHLRSIVLDSPYGTPMLRLTTPLQDTARESSQVMANACLDSPTCASDHPDGMAEYERLVQAVHTHPVEGDAYNADGQLVHVRIDERAMFNSIVFSNLGEVVAAGASLEGGDPGPLLRLGAEYFLPANGVVDWGDPAAYSNGAFTATVCDDLRPPWSWSESRHRRQLDYEMAIRSLPADAFRPFSKLLVGNPWSDFTQVCVWWAKHRRSSPVVPPGAEFPDTPTLVLAGSLEVIQRESQSVASLYPAATFVPQVGAMHETVVWTQCAEGLASGFVESLQVPDTTCSKTPETVLPAIGRFPLAVSDAKPAQVDPAGNNEVGPDERRAVTVAVAAATDALQRSLIGSGDGVGLRGGTFHTDYGASSWVSTLAGVRFAQDLAVDGTVTWEPFGSFTADLVLSDTGSAGGTIHVEGSWQARGPVGTFVVTGELGGLNVDLLVPEA